MAILFIYGLWPAIGNHFGICGMKERVALLNGKINFDSIVGEGTEIVVCAKK